MHVTLDFIKKLNFSSYFWLGCRPSFIREPWILFALKIDWTRCKICLFIFVFLLFGIFFYLSCIVVTLLRPWLPIIRIMVYKTQPTTFLSQFSKLGHWLLAPICLDTLSMKVVNFIVWRTKMHKIVLGHEPIEVDERLTDVAWLTFFRI